MDVDGVDVEMEVDTGASVSLMGEDNYSKMFPGHSLKVKAIQDAPRPKNVAELKSYLGLLTYYGKFMLSLSTHLALLYYLLKSNIKWKWSADQERAFLKSKELLTSSNLLVHFDPFLPIVLACDASQYGIGAVLAH